MSFKKWTTAKINKRKKYAHHLDRRVEPIVIKESLDDGEPVILKSDEKEKKN